MKEWVAPENIADDYIQFVNEALTNESLFAGFKSNSRWNSIVGVSDNWQAPYFYDEIKNHPSIFSKLNDLYVNDTIGNPRPSSINHEGHLFSSHTLRHGQTLCYLLDHFGDLNGKVISEFGIGCGLQCSCCYIIWPDIKDYYLIDLPPVQKFAQKYLKKVGVEKSNISDAPANPDLFIAEYSISEFRGKVLHDYTKRYIMGAQHFFIRSNLWDETEKRDWYLLLREEFDLTILPENPETRWPNTVIIGHRG